MTPLLRDRPKSFHNSLAARIYCKRCREIAGVAYRPTCIGLPVERTSTLVNKLVDKQVHYGISIDRFCFQPCCKSNASVL